MGGFEFLDDVPRASKAWGRLYHYLSLAKPAPEGKELYVFGNLWPYNVIESLQGRAAHPEPRPVARGLIPSR